VARAGETEQVGAGRCPRGVEDLIK